MAFSDVLRVLNSMKAEGVIEEYAVAGAMALVFWTEPVPTWDLDLLVLFPAAAGSPVGLDRIDRWASDHGYPVHEAHVIVEGVPTQFVASPGRLGDEAVQTAATLDYEGVATRVVRPEHLLALYLQPEPRTAKRRERAAMLLEWPGLDRKRLDAILGHQRRGKSKLRRVREPLPLREKVRQVIELQRFVYPLLSCRRSLEPWERPWEIEP
jgi:hypothetical protein